MFASFKIEFYENQHFDEWREDCFYDMLCFDGQGQVVSGQKYGMWECTDDRYQEHMTKIEFNNMEQIQ